MRQEARRRQKSSRLTPKPSLNDLERAIMAEREAALQRARVDLAELLQRERRQNERETVAARIERAAKDVDVDDEIAVESEMADRIKLV